MIGGAGEFALSVARSRDIHSPYAQNMYDARGTLYKGGKMDDITIVVARVVPRLPGRVPTPVQCLRA